MSPAHLNELRRTYRGAQIARWKLERATQGRGRCSDCLQSVEHRTACAMCNAIVCNWCVHWEWADNEQRWQRYLQCEKCFVRAGTTTFTPPGSLTRTRVPPDVCQAWHGVARECRRTPIAPCHVCNRWLCDECRLEDDVTRCTACPELLISGTSGVSLKVFGQQLLRGGLRSRGESALAKPRNPIPGSWGSCRTPRSVVRALAGCRFCQVLSDAVFELVFV